MMSLCSKLVKLLSGKTIVTAESCTGGGIGSAITSVSGSSAVFKGGIISYCDEIKRDVLGVPEVLLKQLGAVSGPVAEAMAAGARKAMDADIAVSVTGLAGPGGDEFGNPVGTVYIGYCDQSRCIHRHYVFSGDREAVRSQAINAAILLIIEHII